jgi:DNA-binding Lrp family transcriptional regulator
MSQIVNLQQNGPARTETRVVLGGSLAKNAVNAISDELSKRILVSSVSEGRTAQEISIEQALPLSSCYRRIRELVDQGLLVVERIVVTREGKRYTLYRSSFRTVEMAADFRELSVSAELNEDVAEKFRRKWFCLSHPDGR